MKANKSDNPSFSYSNREVDAGALAPRTNEEGKLFQEHSKRIRSLALRYAGSNGALADDLAQEGALALVKAHRTYDSSKGASFSTFSSRCVRGRMRNFLRTERRHGVCLPLQDISSRGLVEEDAEDDSVPKTTQECLAEIDAFLFHVDLALSRPAMNQATAAFTSRQREVFHLRFRDGLTVGEIARQLAVSPARISKVLSEATAKLQTVFVTT